MFSLAGSALRGGLPQDLETAAESYRPSLDGLRGIAILMVCASHAGLGNLVPGGFGVTIFFFISGYLITSLLLREMQVTGRVGLHDFYMRRLWRLIPALIGYLLMSDLTTLAFHGPLSLREQLVAVFYLSNYYQLFVGFHGLSSSQGATYSPFNILWSLAIEEHFYLLFAPLVALLRTRRRLFLVVLSLMVLPLIVRICITQFGDAPFAEQYTYSATEARLDSIAFGCLLAVIGRRGWACCDRPGVVLFAATGVLFTLAYRNDYFRQVFRYSMQGGCLFLTIGAILHATRFDWLDRMLSQPVLVWVGKLSYSIYLYQWLALVLANLLLGADWSNLRWQLSFWTLTLGLASLSYYAVERPTMRFRTRYGSQAR